MDFLDQEEVEDLLEQEEGMDLLVVERVPYP